MTFLLQLLCRGFDVTYLITHKKTHLTVRMFQQFNNV